jgi:hypothetical protein
MSVKIASVKIGAAALAAVLACGGASQVAAARDTAPKYEANKCFYSRNVTSFAAPDERNLYVQVNNRDVYHFEMFGPCPDIDWNQRLTLIARPGPWICDGMDAEVVTHAAGIGRQKCMVRHMRKLTPEEVAALPKHARP